jgi:non-heme chloroperoxidase
MTPPAKIIALPNGVSLPYVEQGDPAGAPLLLLHGYTDSWRSYQPLLAQLPSSLRAIALTQRGHGAASRPASGYRQADFAADLALFMDALDLPQAVIVGHSMGGMVAQRFAIDQPQRVAGLVLIGAFTTLRGHREIAGLWDVVSALSDPIDPGFVREFQQGTLARPAPAEFLDMVVAESLTVPARVWCDALAGLLTHDTAAELGRITAPTLIVWGDQDTIAAQDMQQRLQAGLANATLVSYRGNGHGVHWEEPARVAHDIAAFVHRLTGLRLPGADRLRA